MFILVLQLTAVRTSKAVCAEAEDPSKDSGPTSRAQTRDCDTFRPRPTTRAQASHGTKEAKDLGGKPGYDSTLPSSSTILRRGMVCTACIIGGEAPH